jgi:hypothetical protein
LNFDSVSDFWIAGVVLDWSFLLLCLVAEKMEGKVVWGRVENNVICVVEFIALIPSLHFFSPAELRGLLSG